jgi:aryl-alcohol dehydrogenase-like predicted oxidoreductase
VGRAFSSTRDEVVIATKVGNQWRSDGSGWDWNPSKKYILESVDKSLRRLQTDYIDLYQLHGGTIEDPINETIEAFELLKQQGKIRYYGISSIRPNVIQAYIERSKITSVMMQYSLIDRRPDESCLGLLADHNIAVLARGAMAGGLLIDKPAKPYLNYKENEVAKASALVNDLSNAHRTKTAVAIQFVLQHPAITSVVAGLRTDKQLGEVIGALNAPPLNQTEIQKLKEVLKANQYTDHRV